MRQNRVSKNSPKTRFNDVRCADGRKIKKGIYIDIKSQIAENALTRNVNRLCLRNKAATKNKKTESRLAFRFSLIAYFLIIFSQ